jgi:3-deoxy-manno-octulosonate cytidylyltransferase (CMP-KDO synthetase)
MVKRIVGVIPARLESARLPRKPLLSLLGHPLIAWVYARARAAKELSELLVATDSDEILEWCRSLRIPVMMTSPAHRSGTDRLLEVLARQTNEGEQATIYVNIQGDEPLIDVSHISLLLGPFEDSPETLVSTLKVALSAAEARDPNKVKVVTDASGRALYFSRSPIPFYRDNRDDLKYYKHLGIYAYTGEALERFRSLRRGEIESAEGLEQLRFLENGIEITVVETSQDTVGVDTPEDLRAAEEYLRRKGIQFPEF